MSARKSASSTRTQLREFCTEEPIVLELRRRDKQISRATLYFDEREDREPRYHVRRRFCDLANNDSIDFDRDHSVNPLIKRAAEALVRRNIGRLWDESSAERAVTPERPTVLDCIMVCSNARTDHEIDEAFEVLHDYIMAATNQKSFHELHALLDVIAAKIRTLPPELSMAALSFTAVSKDQIKDWGQFREAIGDALANDAEDKQRLLDGL